MAVSCGSQGLQKLRNLKSGVKSLTFHGDLGKVIMLLAAAPRPLHIGIYLYYITYKYTEHKEVYMIYSYMYTTSYMCRYI